MDVKDGGLGGAFFGSVRRDYGRKRSDKLLYDLNTL